MLQHRISANNLPHAPHTAHTCTRQASKLRQNHEAGPNNFGQFVKLFENIRCLVISTSHRMSPEFHRPPPTALSSPELEDGHLTELRECNM